MNFRKKNTVFICIIILFIHFSLYTADLTIPSLEIISHVAYDEGSDYIILRTDGEMEINIEGGYTFGAGVVFGFQSSDLESAISEGTAGLVFKSGRITIREIMGPLLSFSFFIGENDILCSGRGFVDYFGTELIETNYSGFMYFPDTQVYDGIHTISGTGCAVSLRPISDLLLLNLYAYQDNYFVDASGDFKPGIYSCDIRTILNLNRIKLDFFIGATGPVADAGLYRTGLLFYAKAGPAEIFTQIGMPRWDPVDDAFGINLFHLLMEVKLNLGILGITPSVFLHPGYYHQDETNEEEMMDININFTFGDLSKHFISGGIEGNFSFTEDVIEGLNIKVFPFFSFITPGVLWELKCGVTLFSDPLPYDNIQGMFEGFIGIKADF